MGKVRILDARVAGRQSEVLHHPRVEPLTAKAVLGKRPSGLHSVGAETTMLEALKLMAKHGLTAVPVLDNGRMVGVFSEHEYVHTSIAATRPISAVPVSEVITSCDVFANATDSAHQCLSLMRENHLQYLPVREEGKLIGMLLFDDLLQDMVDYLQRIIKENELDQQVASLRGTYSC